MKQLIFSLIVFSLVIGSIHAQIAKPKTDPHTVDADIGGSRKGSPTDDDVIKREEESINNDQAWLKELREKAEKFTFQAEVNRMMKLIINSLYRNKEIFLRELISNASDALDKIRLLSLTEPNVLDSTTELTIRIKVDKDAGVLHITDTGIGMTRNDLINNLGTIAKSGTAEFLNKMQDAAANSQDMNDMIGQFGVGFYSAFLVADRIVVTTKHNDDKQYVWESDASSFSIAEDTRDNGLPRGTTISLYLKPEAKDFLEHERITNLIKKYSQFITFPIYLWTYHTEQVEEPLDEEEKDQVKDGEKEPEKEKSEDEIDVEEEKDEKEKPKTKKVDKTVWDWKALNINKPIWTRPPAEITDEEYNQFYKALTKETKDPLTKIHFTAEGEIGFKSLLYIPSTQSPESFNKYGTNNNNIKLYVRRIFITDEFNDFMPSYLAFIQGVVDSDDLPLNISREMLQNHKLLMVIKKKLTRKVLGILKKLDDEEYDKFWKEFSVNIKLGVVEDSGNRAKLSRLLKFVSSRDGKLTFLADYVERMKDKPNQDQIYYIAGSSLEEVKNSPLVEKLTQKGYEVLFLTEAVDEYAISAIPDFDGKKFQNVAKEGFSLPKSEGQKTLMEKLTKTFEPLTKWLGDFALKDKIAKAAVSERLSVSPCALIAGVFGWTGNMERLAISNAHKKADDPQRSYYLNQKKTLEINPSHPVIRELLRRVNDNPDDAEANDIALLLFRTATLRSGYMLQETTQFAHSIDRMIRKSLGISADEQYEEEEEFIEESVPSEETPEPEIYAEHDEL